MLPFAVNSGEGGAEAGHVMHLKPHAAAEPASKVGGDAACHYLKPHGAAEPSGKVGGDAAAFYLKPHVIAEPSGKVCLPCWCSGAAVWSGPLGQDV